jgi:prevent-host-death family protein
MNVKILTKSNEYDIIIFITDRLGGAFLEISEVLERLVPITQFNKGKSSRLFSRVQKGEPLIVMKNNNPIAVIISPEDYSIVEQYLSDKKQEQ